VFQSAGVAKLVYALDLGSSAARRESSSLSFRTKYQVGSVEDSSQIIRAKKVAQIHKIVRKNHAGFY
jgi:hypothetical protein